VGGSRKGLSPHYSLGKANGGGDQSRKQTKNVKDKIREDLAWDHSCYDYKKGPFGESMGGRDILGGDIKNKPY